MGIFIEATLDSELRFQHKQVAHRAYRMDSNGGAHPLCTRWRLGGGGPLSNAEAVAVDGSARVRYEKFARQLTPTTVEINVTQPPDGRPTQIHVEGSYLSSTTLKLIIPEPDTTTIADNGYVFGFKRSAGVADTKIRLQLEPQRIGPLKGCLVIYARSWRSIVCFPVRQPMDSCGCGINVHHANDHLLCLEALVSADHNVRFRFWLLIIGEATSRPCGQDFSITTRSCHEPALPVRHRALLG